MVREMSLMCPGVTKRDSDGDGWRGKGDELLSEMVKGRVEGGLLVKLRGMSGKG